MGEIKSLTGLRFIAALFVFTFHVNIRFPISSNKFIVAFYSKGTLGMCIFFILSGFVISLSYSKGESKYGYIIKRFARIYPVYIVAAFLSLPWILPEWNNNEIVNSLGKLTVLIFSLVFLLQAWFTPLFDYWNNGSSWSLSVEAFFYASFLLIVPIIKDSKIKRLKIIICIIIFLEVIKSLVLIFYGNSTSSNIFREVYMIPAYRLPEFMLGSVLFYIRQKKRIFTRKYYSSAIVFTLAVILTFLNVDLFHADVFDFIIIPLIGFLVYILSFEQCLISKILSFSLFTYGGRISYCFYSLQAPLLLLAIEKHQSIIKTFPFLKNNISFSLLLFSILFLISIMTYHLLEEPLRKKIITRYS